MTDPGNSTQDLDSQVEALHAYVEGLDDLSEEGERMLRSLDRENAERTDAAQNGMSAVEFSIEES